MWFDYLSQFSFYTEIIAFVFIFIVGLGLLFSKEKYPKLLKLLAWVSVYAFFNFMGCTYLLSEQFDASMERMG